MPLAHLPLEIWIQVASHLDCETGCALACVSRQFASIPQTPNFHAPHRLPKLDSLLEEFLAEPPSPPTATTIAIPITFSSARDSSPPPKDDHRRWRQVLSRTGFADFDRRTTVAMFQDVGEDRRALYRLRGAVGEQGLRLQVLHVDHGAMDLFMKLARLERAIGFVDEAEPVLAQLRAGRGDVAEAGVAARRCAARYLTILTQPESLEVPFGELPPGHQLPGGEPLGEAEAVAWMEYVLERMTEARANYARKCMAIFEELGARHRRFAQGLKVCLLTKRMLVEVMGRCVGASL